MQNKTLPMPGNIQEYHAQRKDTASCDSYGSTYETIKALDRLLEPFSLEVLLLDDGSSDYTFKVVPRPKQKCNGDGGDRR